jgi:hypothetical protein
MGWSLALYFSVRRVVLPVPALAPAKALRLDASVPTRRRSSRAPRAAGSAATTSERPRGVAVATEPRQEAAVVAAATTAATAASAVPPASIPAAGGQAPVVEIPDDDAPPPGWGQWEDWPMPAPEPATGVLVMREDNRVMARQPTHGAEASSSRGGLPAPDVTVARPEQEREHTSAPPDHLTRSRPSWHCGKSFETTAPHSIMR